MEEEDSLLRGIPCQKSCTLKNYDWTVICTRVDDGGKTPSDATCWQSLTLVEGSFRGWLITNRNSLMADLSRQRIQREGVRCYAGPRKGKGRKRPFYAPSDASVRQNILGLRTGVTDLSSNQLPERQDSSHEHIFQWLNDPQMISC